MTSTARKRSLLEEVPKRRKLAKVDVSAPKIVAEPIKEAVELLTKQRALSIVDFKQPLQLVEDHPVPELNDHDVLISNKAVGLNPIDWKGKKYKFGIYHFPWINGRESSGIVVKVGSAIDHLKVGDKVIVSSTSYRDNRTSTFQQFTAIDSRLVWKLPESFSYEDGATVGVGLVTAGVIFYDSFKIKEGEKLAGSIVVWGGATVVGLYVTQLAKIHGLRVIAVASLDNKAYLEELGVDHVINRFQDAATIVSEVLKADPAVKYGVDCVSKESAASVIDILQKSTTKETLFSAIVGKPKNIEKVDVREVVIKNFHENIDFGKWFVDLTTGYFASNQIRPVRYKHYKGGLHLIDVALKDLEQVGAKGEKFVVSLD